MTSFDGSVLNVTQVLSRPFTVDAVIVVVRLLFNFYLKVSFKKYPVIFSNDRCYVCWYLCQVILTFFVSEH